jgi:hypothetical protein
MRILSSSVSLAASVTTTATEVRSERSLFWTGDPPPRDGARTVPAGDRLRATPATPAIPARGEGPATPAIPATPARPQRAGEGDGDGEDPGRDGLTARDEIRLLILRRTFGLEGGLHAAAHEIQQAYADGAAEAAETSAAFSRAEAAASPATAPSRAGWGLEVDVSVQRTEATTVAFAAAEVTTADGRHLETAATLEMQRLAVTTAELQLRAGDRRLATDPLAVNLAGAPVAFDGTQHLDLDGDGVAEEVAQLASGSAWLARDLDGSGAVEAGGELFGRRRATASASSPPWTRTATAGSTRATPPSPGSRSGTASSSRRCPPQGSGRSTPARRRRPSR